MGTEVRLFTYFALISMISGWKKPCFDANNSYYVELLLHSETIESVVYCKMLIKLTILMELIRSYFHTLV
jgi:hypothetical protein